MNKTGVQKKHAKVIADSFDLLGVVGVFRTGNLQSLKWEEEGATVVDSNGSTRHISCASKDKHVPGKTAETGPFAGLVPKNAMDSKLGDKYKESHDNPSVRDEVQLNIDRTQAKIDDAIEQGLVTVAIVEAEGERMEVLADKEGRPLRSDYDLLSLAPSNDRKHMTDIYKDDDFGITNRITTMTAQVVNNRLEENDKRLGKVDKNSHNMSVDEYNKGHASKMILHGPDSYNPYADPLSITPSRPMYAVYPDKKAKILKSNDDLIGYYKDMKKLGYDLPINPAWKIDFGKEFDSHIVNLYDVPSTPPKDLASVMVDKEIAAKEKSTIEKMFDRGGIADRKEKISNVLLLELASRAMEHDIDNNDAKAQKFWNKFNKLEDSFQKRHDNEMSVIANYVTSNKIISYQQIQANGDDGLKSELANSLISDKNTERVLKANLRSSSYKEIEKQAKQSDKPVSPTLNIAKKVRNNLAER